MPKVPKVKELCQFYLLYRSDAEGAEFFIKKFSLCALCGELYLTKFLDGGLQLGMGCGVFFQRNTFLKSLPALQ